MELTVLGAGAAYPRPGGACSGFLVRKGGCTVWLDAGNGSFSRLQEHVSHLELDALVLSHHHADHIADVLPLMYARAFDERAFDPLPVYAPADVPDIVSAPLGEHSREIFGRTFDFRVIAGGPFEVAGLRFEPFATRHPVETYGFRISDGERLLVYSADTCEFPELPGHCRGADLLLCESNFVGDVEAPPGLHLFAREAGAVASKAGAGRLLLTHVWATHDLADAVEEAGSAYDGALETAAEGSVYRV